MVGLETLRSFRQRDDGAIAAVFGVALLVMLLSAGVAIDYARIHNLKSRLQSDLDAAVLGAATRAKNVEDIQGIAQQYFDQNWKDKLDVTGAAIAVARSEANKIAGTAEANVPMTLMALAGFDTMTIHAQTEVEVAGQHVEVSLVLDTTASMGGPKLDALKEASKALIDLAFEMPEADERIKIGIVPFGAYVNVGLDKRDEDWLSVENDATITHTACRMESPVLSSTCHKETFTGYNDGTPYTYEADVCEYTYGPPVEVCTPWDETKTWYGCVGSRNSPLDTQDLDYETKVPGLMNYTCGAPVTGLTNEKDELKDKIDALVATGDTYIPAGLMWGWTTLSKAAPFDEARGYGEKPDGLPVRKMMVLMTDGFNTLYPSYPYHYSQVSGEQANTLTQELCINLKAPPSNIEIVAVAFEVDNEDIKNILRACASSPAKFFDAPTPEDLKQAFKDIARSFNPLRLTR